MNRYSSFIILLIGVLLPALAQGQVKSPLTRAQIDSIVNPKPLPNGDSYLKVETKSINFGTLNDTDSPVECTFKIESATNQELRVTQVKTTCGCTVAKFDTTTLVKGDKGTITLTYSPKGYKGDISVKGYIYTNISSKQPTAVVELTGHVKSSDQWSHLPYKMGALRVKNKRVTFEPIGKGMSPTMTILCANSGTTPIEIRGSELPEFATLKCVPTTLQPNSEGELLITINGAALPTDESWHQFSFKIEGVDAQPIERTIKVTIEK